MNEGTVSMLLQWRPRAADHHILWTLQVVEDHDNLFVMAELVHFVGIGLLAWKLLKKKNAGGERIALHSLCCFEHIRPHL
jgi:hypothetical protein